MAEFAWEARTRTGEIRKGVMAGDDVAAVQSRLRQQQLNPIKVSRSFNFNITIGSGVGIKDLVTFTRLFGTMVDAGLPLVQALDILATQQKNKRFAALLKDVKNTVEQGSTFSDALGKHPKVFDALFVNLVRAGESGGILDSIMRRLSVYIEKRQKLIRQVKSALTYPTIVLVLAIGMMIAMLTYVIPTFADLFKEIGGENNKLPALTEGVIAVSNAFVSNLPWILLFVVLAAASFAVFYRRPAGRLAVHRAMLRFPVIGDVLRKVAVARFTRTLGTLLQSGVPILDALEICAKSAGNLVIENAINLVARRISEGKTMAEPLAATGVFPPMVVQMIGVGEQTGALDQMLEKIADFYEEETDVAVASLTSMLEPLFMVVVGAMVGTVLAAMYLPMFHLADNLKAK